MQWDEKLKGKELKLYLALPETCRTSATKKKLRGAGKNL